MKPTFQSNLVHTTFLQREHQSKHHSYDDEMAVFRLLKEGDLDCIALSNKVFSSDMTGKLSEDTRRNYQYLFVASVTLATRFAIEGGLGFEVAYNLSDLYIQKMDKLQKVEAIIALQNEMMMDFTMRVADHKKESAYSKPILLCMDYVYYHLHEAIRVEDLSRQVGLSRAYLSTLFKKETGITLSAYIRHKRVEAAQNMLRFSTYTFQEIGDYLAFSNHSHFISVFKKQTGYTPKAYQNKYFRHHW